MHKETLLEYSVKCAVYNIIRSHIYTAASAMHKYFRQYYIFTMGENAYRYIHLLLLLLERSV